MVIGASSEAQRKNLELFLAKYFCLTERENLAMV
jgi:hypothetical protein